MCEFEDGDSCDICKSEVFGKSIEMVKEQSTRALQEQAIVAG